MNNIEKYGGSKQLMFVAGHSAGGYLTSMIGLDKRWLKPYSLDPNQLAGLIPFSGQSITHFTIREERGIGQRTPVIDDLAPVYHVRKDAPPMLLISGDRNQELVGRYEETAYFWRMLKEVGHRDVELLELQGYDHGGMAEPAFPLLLKFVKSRAKLTEDAKAR
jgi:acetyl esterase/lipase